MAEAGAIHVHHEKTTAKFLVGGSIAETMISIGALVLGILGLVGILPGFMLAISIIALGASFLFEGGAVASRLSDLLHETTEGRMDVTEYGGGLSAEFVGGLAGVALGILSLVGLVPQVLTSVAIITFGATLAMGAGVKNRLAFLHIGREEQETGQFIAREALRASSGVQVLVGIGAIVLGILALLQFDPGILNLIGVIAVSGAVLIGGTAIGTKMIELFRY